MPRFCNDPLTPGHHKEVLRTLRKKGARISPRAAKAFAPYSDEDLRRVIPRHYPLSIPGDVIPGIPLRRPPRH